MGATLDKIINQSPSLEQKKIQNPFYLWGPVAKPESVALAITSPSKQALTEIYICLTFLTVLLVTVAILAGVIYYLRSRHRQLFRNLQTSFFLHYFGRIYTHFNKRVAEGRSVIPMSKRVKDIRKEKKVRCTTAENPQVIAVIQSTSKDLLEEPEGVSQNMKRKVEISFDGEKNGIIALIGSQGGSKMKCLEELAGNKEMMETHNKFQDWTSTLFAQQQPPINSV